MAFVLSYCLKLASENLAGLQGLEWSVWAGVTFYYLSLRIAIEIFGVSVNFKYLVPRVFAGFMIVRSWATKMVLLRS